ncbi:MAG: DNA polymerase III subunit gamma/tau, partial [Comamonadaceae bacterium]
ALSLTDQAIAFGNGELIEVGVRQMLGSVDRGHVFKLIEALAVGDGKTVVDTSEALRRDGMSAASTLEEMTAVLQSMAVLQAVPSRAAPTDATDPDAADTARLAALMPQDETQLLYSLCLHGRGELGLAPDEYAALTMVLLRLLAFKPGASSASAEKKTLNKAAAPAGRALEAAPEPVRRAPEPQGQPVSEPVAAPAPAVVAAPVAVAVRASAPVAPPPGRVLQVVDNERPPSRDAMPAPVAAPVMSVPVRQQVEPRQDVIVAATAPAGVTITEEGNHWYAVVRQLVTTEAITALVRELALQSQLIARDTDQWLLRVERESLNQGNSRDRLQAALAGAGHA